MTDRVWWPQVAEFARNHNAYCLIIAVQLPWPYPAVAVDRRGSTFWWCRVFRHAGQRAAIGHPEFDREFRTN